jgi:hypothetical protein
MDKATAQAGDLEQRIRRIEDRQALGELISRYGVAVDDRDFDTVAAMYLPDSEFGGIKGLEAIMSFYRERLGLYGPTYHYAHTHHFDFSSDDEASGVVSAHAEIGLNGEALWLGLRYLDRYARVRGRWHFQARVIKFRYVLPLPELATSYSEPLRNRWPGVAPVLADIPDQVPTYIASRTAGKR